jgi:hypothetical protein
MITANNVHELFDYRDGKLYWKQSVGQRIKVGNEAGSKSKTTGYRVVGYGGKSYAAHRVVWLMHTGKWPDGQIDHMNHDRCDNKIQNLRVTTPSENRKNSAQLGITYRAKKGKYEVTYCGKYVGLFVSKQDALAARGLAEFLDPQHLRTAL